jgi:hypothetical protein
MWSITPGCPAPTFRGSEVIEFLILYAGLAQVHLDLAVHAQPVAVEREIRPRHDVEAERADIEVLGPFEVPGAHKIMIQFGQRHVCSLRCWCWRRGLDRDGEK